MYNSIKCAEAVGDAVISAFPGGGFVVTAKNIVEDVVMYGARKLFSIFA